MLKAGRKVEEDFRVVLRGWKKQEGGRGPKSDWPGYYTALLMVCVLGGNVCFPFVSFFLFFRLYLLL